MYEIMKSVIMSGRYELADMLKKIDTVWLQAGITDGQRTELAGIARENAVPENSYASLQRQVGTLFENYAELAERIRKLEGGTGELDQEEYPEYIQPAGAHDAYHAGDKVTYNGVKYTCIAPDGVAVVWDPATYPEYWQQEAES